MAICSHGNMLYYTTVTLLLLAHPRITIAYILCDRLLCTMVSLLNQRSHSIFMVLHGCLTETSRVEPLVTM